MQLTLRQFADISHANALAQGALFSVIPAENVDALDGRLTQADIDAIGHGIFDQATPLVLDAIADNTRLQAIGVLLREAEDWLCRLATVSGNQAPSFFSSLREPSGSPA